MALQQLFLSFKAQDMVKQQYCSCKYHLGIDWVEAVSAEVNQAGTGFFSLQEVSAWVCLVYVA